MHYQQDRAAIPKKSGDFKNVSALHIDNHYSESHSLCGGLRAVGPASEIRVFDAITNKLKRILSPDGQKVIREFVE